MANIFEKLMPGDGVGYALAGTIPSNYLDGILKMVPTKVYMYVKSYWMKSGETIIDDTFRLSTSYAQNAISTRLPTIGHAFKYDANKNDIKATLAWIEVSGALIHNISIDAITCSSITTVPTFGDIFPALFVKVKGMFRNAESARRIYEADRNYTLHRVRATMLYKYKVVVEDSNGWTADNIPDYQKIMEKMSTWTYRGYKTLVAILNYTV